MLAQIPATVTAVGPSQVSLVLEGDQAVTLDGRYFSGALQVGDQYVVSLLPESQATLARHDLAQAMLNELISDVPAPETTN